MYSPRIDRDLVTKLYMIRKARCKPMTTVVNEILREALANIHIISEKRNVKVEQEVWKEVLEG